MMRKSVVSVMVLGAFLVGTTVCVEARSLFSARRAFGLASLAGSSFFFKEAWDYHEKANSTYDEYKLADSKEEAERLYNKTSRYDRRSEVHLLVGSLLALNGLRLLFIGGIEDWDEADQRRAEVARSPRDLAIQMGHTSVRLEGDPRHQEIRMSIDHRF